MKKITFVVMAMFLSITFYPTTTEASVTKATTTSAMVVNGYTETAETKALLTRLDKIEKMDKSKLNGSEKKALRKEVRSIKKQLEETGAYIYLSSAAIVVIVVLLIILF
jgi:hypothetical protein